MEYQCLHLKKNLYKTCQRICFYLAKFAAHHPPLFLSSCFLVNCSLIDFPVKAQPSFCSFKAAICDYCYIRCCFGQSKISRSHVGSLKNVLLLEDPPCIYWHFLKSPTNIGYILVLRVADSVFILTLCSVRD